MEIIYGKKLNEQQIKEVVLISSECGILFDTARLLFYRGVDTVKKAKAFLAPSKKGFHNPFLLSGMQEAVTRIIKAKEKNERILIFGDYDADGICATAILYNCLTKLGIVADCYVPERDEGYGLNFNIIKTIKEEKGVDLLITVDCGISGADTIEEIKNLGVDVIVTDHHEPPQDLPDCIKINPKLFGQDYPFSELCGAGVAYKLGYALIKEKADENLDLVALATIADSMDLIGENRDLVVEGLKLFNNQKTLRMQFKYLLSDNNKPITAQTLAYIIAPRVNAGGRMGDAKSVLKLFTTFDEKLVFELSALLCSYNIARQSECDRIYQQAKQKIKEQKRENDEIILVSDTDWKVGFVGIVAAKLVEEYCRPVIVFAGHDDYLKGSARSVESFNIYDAITQVKDILISYGGHSQAAGVAVKKENFELLSSLLNSFVKENNIKIDTRQIINAEWEITKPISIRFAKELEMLEPFGVGNRRPLFTTKVYEVDSVPLKAGSAHFSFKTDVLEMLDFNGQKNVVPLSLPIQKKVIFEINLSNFKNHESLKGYVRAVCPEYGDYSGISESVFYRQLKQLLIDYDKPPILSIKKEDLVFNADTFYIVSDPINLSKYPESSSCSIKIFEPNGENGVQLCVLPSFIPEGFDKVTYLDKPIQYFDTKAKVSVVEENCGYKQFDCLSTERTEFIDFFNRLKNLVGKPFKNAVAFCNKHFSKSEIYQALFVLEVFCELKIFYVKNGVFSYNEKVKNTLTNSKVYSKIYSLKG